MFAPIRLVTAVAIGVIATATSNDGSDYAAADDGSDHVVDDASETKIQSGDTIAILGGTWVEQMQRDGNFAATLHSDLHDAGVQRIAVRNLGWSGDDVHGYARKVFGDPAEGTERLMRDIAVARPDVLVIAYGTSEAADAEMSASDYETSLRRLIQTVDSVRQIYLLPPVSMPGYRVDGYADRIDQLRRVTRRVADDTTAITIDAAIDAGPDQVDSRGLILNPIGASRVASLVAASLVGGSKMTDATQSDADRISAELRDAVVRSNRQFFYRYRPQNETYLFLFRKHEQGNNAAEVPEFERWTREADQAVWRRLAKP